MAKSIIDLFKDANSYKNGVDYSKGPALGQEKTPMSVDLTGTVEEKIKTGTNRSSTVKEARGGAVGDKTPSGYKPGKGYSTAVKYD